MTKNEANKETQKHIYNVKKVINKICDELYYRGHDHDLSKMVSPEVEIFAEYTDKLKSTTYGSKEYKQYLKDMKPALDHHYKHNRHHPEHFEDEMWATFRESPINCMNLIDVIEMICDWKAATKRHTDGDFIKSVKYNTERFGMSKQLASIIINTADILEEVFENEKS
jgi:hypothetical protein